MRTNIFLIFFITIFMIYLNFSVGYPGNNAANTGLAFLKLGAGSRAIGMGEAFTAVANDASSAYWNPAGLTNLSRTELMFTHNKWLQDMTNEFFAAGFQMGQNAFGISFMSQTIVGIERRVKALAEPLDILSTHDVMFGFSFARKIGRNFGYGVTLKYLYQKMYIESASGLAVDIGLQFKTPLKKLTTGIAWQNFGVMTKLREEATRLPQTIRLGAAYQLPIQNLQGELTLAADFMNLLHSTSHLSFGLEYEFLKYFVFRSGYQVGFEEKGIHGGLGLLFHRYRFDYAYVPFTSDLGNSHRISFGVGF